MEKGILYLLNNMIRYLGQQKLSSSKQAYISPQRLHKGSNTITFRYKKNLFPIKESKTHNLLQIY